MAICRGTWPDGSICAHSLYECRECGNIGCGRLHCTNSLRNKEDKCATCGSVGAPKKYVEWAAGDSAKRVHPVTATNYI